MTRFRAPSHATKQTLFELAENRDGLHGYDIMKATGVKPGTLYPMLARLEKQGLMFAHWAPSPDPGRPPRHIYSLTPNGIAFVQRLSNEETQASSRSPKSGMQI